MKELLSLIKGGRALTPAQRKQYKPEIDELKSRAKIANKGIIPHICAGQRCETCNSISGKEHPVTGYCFHCDTDNWILRSSFWKNNATFVVG